MTLFNNMLLYVSLNGWSVLGLITYMKKLLDSDWLRVVQFFLNKVQKKPNKVQKYLTKYKLYKNS